MLFGTIVNGIVVLILISSCLSLLYGNAIDFCVLVLYPATLLKSVIQVAFVWFLFGISA